MPFNIKLYEEIIRWDAEKRIQEALSDENVQRINELYDAPNGLFRRMLHFDRQCLHSLLELTYLKYSPAEDTLGGAKRDEIKFISTLVSVYINAFLDDTPLALRYYKYEDKPASIDIVPCTKNDKGAMMRLAWANDNEKFIDTDDMHKILDRVEQKQKEYLNWLITRGNEAAKSMYKNMKPEFIAY